MKRALAAAFCLLLAAGFAVLGAWQVERRASKLALIARVESRVRAAPAALPQPRGGEDLAYTRVRATGRFVAGRDALVQAVTVHGPGWWVMTPLRTAGMTLLVNRGFVDAAHRGVRPPAGDVSVIGLIRDSEPGGAFLRANDPAADRWYSRDVAAIARARGIADPAPFFLDAAATPGAWPIGGLTIVRFANNHLVYVATWFALAGMALAGALLLLRDGGRAR